MSHQENSVMQTFHKSLHMFAMPVEELAISLACYMCYWIFFSEVGKHIVLFLMEWTSRHLFACNGVECEAVNIYDFLFLLKK